MRRQLMVVVSVVALAGAACGSDSDPTVEVPAGGGSTTTNASRPSTTTRGTTAIDDTGEDLDAFEGTAVERPGDDYGLLTTVRHAEHDDFYRVVFEFRDGVPGVKLGFTQRPVVQDGSGDEIDVSGEAVLLVQFEPSSGYDLEANKESYTGPKRLEVEQEPVVELVRVSDFEAHLDWAIGVDKGSRFRLTTLSDPPRAVIDIQAP